MQRLVKRGKRDRARVRPAGAVPLAFMPIAVDSEAVRRTLREREAAGGVETVLAHQRLPGGEERGGERHAEIERRVAVELADAVMPPVRRDGGEEFAISVPKTPDDGFPDRRGLLLETIGERGVAGHAGDCGYRVRLGPHRGIHHDAGACRRKRQLRPFVAAVHHEQPRIRVLRGVE